MSTASAWRVRVEPWVQADVARAGLSRNNLNRVSFDLHNDLPAGVDHYRGARIHPGSPSCFWYRRTYVEGIRLHRFDFVVRDATPGLLEVIWVIHTA